MWPFALNKARDTSYDITLNMLNMWPLTELNLDQI